MPDEPDWRWKSTILCAQMNDQRLPPQPLMPGQRLPLSLRKALVGVIIAIIGGVLAEPINALLRYIFKHLNPTAMVGVAVAVVAVVLGLVMFWIARQGRRSRRLSTTLWFLGVFALGFVGGTLIHRKPPPPPLQLAIRITTVPVIGSGPREQDDIRGDVKGFEGLLAYTNYWVVIYAYTKVTPGVNPWSVQPTTDSRLTPIGIDGTWNNRIYLGSRYAAILVTNGYSPPPSLGALPVPGGSILAITDVEGRKR